MSSGAEAPVPVQLTQVFKTSQDHIAAFAVCHGTFLVRLSSDGSYAISIVCNNKVEHLKIEKTDQGLGFAEPYNIHPTLQDLVIHYSQHSLCEHNPVLTTTLETPIGTVLSQQEATIYVPMKDMDIK